MPTTPPSAFVADIALFGAVHLDTIAHARIAIERETSTPARFLQRPGGVATNVARALCRLGLACALNGAVGRDGEGAALTAQLAREGIDLSRLIESNFPTGRYLALHDPDGSLAAAVVDGRITDGLAADAFEPLGAATVSAAVWFVEANLPSALIERLSGMAEGRLVVANAVSVAKAPRLLPALPKIGMLFCNRAEAAALLETDVNTPTARLAEGLCKLGARACCVTNGDRPLGYCDAAGTAELSPFKVSPVDVTGAGDALIAGWLAETLRNASPLAALQTGLAAAAITLEAPGGAPENLNWEEIGRKLSAFDTSS